MRALRKRGDDGAAAVEFALIGCFVLIPLMFGILTFGLAFAQKLALGNAAREGARYGIFVDRSCQEVFAAVQRAGGSVGMSAESMRIEIGINEGAPLCTYDGDGGYSPDWEASDDVNPCEDAEIDDEIVVRAEHNVDLFAPSPLSGVGENIEISSTGVFRCE
jgi:hypothetical protein